LPVIAPLLFAEPGCESFSGNFRLAHSALPTNRDFWPIQCGNSNVSFFETFIIIRAPAAIDESGFRKSWPSTAMNCSRNSENLTLA
jgi:hypothetical protein